MTNALLTLAAWVKLIFHLFDYWRNCDSQNISRYDPDFPFRVFVRCYQYISQTKRKVSWSRSYEKPAFQHQHLKRRWLSASLNARQSGWDRLWDLQLYKITSLQTQIMKFLNATTYLWFYWHVIRMNLDYFGFIQVGASWVQ